MHPSRRWGIVAWVVALILGAGASARMEPPSVFTTLSLDEALRESIRTRRLVIVYLRGTGAAFDKMDETTWRSPTLRAWMLWHGIAIKVDAIEDPKNFKALNQMVQRSMRPKDSLGRPTRINYNAQRKPMILVFRDGKLARTIPDFRFQGFLGEFDPILSSMGLGSPGPDMNTFYPKQFQILYQLDVYMDVLRSLEPAWFAMHEQMNPMPAPPEPPPPLHPVGDENAGAFLDPDPGPGGIDVLSVLMDARAHVDDQALHDATGRYTWLWERTDALDPALRTVRSTLVADEIAGLASRRQGSRARFTTLRDRALERQPWWTYEDMYEWMVLCRVVGDADAMMDHLLRNAVEDAEASFMSAPEKVAYELLTGPAGPFHTVTAGTLLDWMQSQSRHLQDDAPRQMIPDQWADLQALRRRLFLDAACRAYAAFLRAGDEARAEQAASLAVASLDDAPTRVALVATAIAAGHPRPRRHLMLLDEAAARGDTHDRTSLRERLAQLP